MCCSSGMRFRCQPAKAAVPVLGCLCPARFTKLYAQVFCLLTESKAVVRMFLVVRPNLRAREIGAKAMRAPIDLSPPKHFAPFNVLARSPGTRTKVCFYLYHLMLRLKETLVNQLTPHVRAFAR